MATTVPEPPKIKEPRSPRGGNSGNGDFRNLVPNDGTSRVVQEYAPPPSKTGIWVALAAISMTFAAFTSALIVRQGAAMDWHHLTPPRILYFNTLVLLASSVTLQMSRREIAIFMGGKNFDLKPARWLYFTMFLGVVFVAGQYVAWMQLRSEGLYLATNPNSSFFYLLTSVHALHVLGGLVGLTYVMRKLRRVTLRRSTLDAFSNYWHFMGILWVYLLLLLWMKL
jgi:cytochrome c oxidase subunit 3